MSQQSPQDDFIRERLSSNLEAYSNNLVLNKLTPSRSKRDGNGNGNGVGGHGDDGSGMSSVRRSTASRKSTPDWDKKYPKKNDSNIVTSPVKIIRQFNNGSGDEYDTTGTFETHNGATTVKQPLKSSPKKPLRKGTPGKVKSVRSPRKYDNDGEEQIAQHTRSSRKKSLEASKTTKDLPDSSSRRIVTNSHVNHTITAREDEDDDYLGIHHKSNSTLLSEIPSDILSPEKHIYPAENIKKSSSAIPSAIPSAVKTNTQATQLLAQSYPRISPPKPQTFTSVTDQLIENSKIQADTPSKRSNSFLSARDGLDSNVKDRRGTSLPRTFANSVMEEFDDDDDNSANAKIYSDIMPSNRRFDIANTHDWPSSMQKKNLKAPVPIYSDHDVHVSISPGTKPPPLPSTNIFDSLKKPTVSNESFHHLNDFIRNPLIDEDRYRAATQADVESERRSFELREKAKRDSKSPQKNESTEKISRPSSENKKKPRSSPSRQLDLSQFESSDEEPVPESTVPLNEERELFKSVKRQVEQPIETSTTNKKSKPSLYPVIAPQSQSQSPTRARPEPPKEKPKIPLYPTIPPLERPSRISSTMIDNISDIIEDKPIVILQSQAESSTLVEPPKSIQKTSVTTTLVSKPEVLGDADNWSKSQWKTFLKAFKRFKQTNNRSIFSDRLLEYLRCDQDEIKLKIKFMLDHENEFKKTISPT